ncbi:hypothetical protein DMN91_000072 [Ooceraea biroi]|uniref:Venom serine protease n=1 Tax=Ooceraea biroi TaxID=2015173 RepID=A0A3L8E2R0_OOCBI|nr:hypothetical protein DMN91_000072 [Ooceraea biroi]
MEFHWKFYWCMEFRAILFGLLLSFMMLSGVRAAGCNYYETLTPGEIKRVANPGFPNSYQGGNQCKWQLMSASPLKINCSVNILPSSDCSEDYLSIQFAGQNAHKYCGNGTFTVEGTNVTITLDTPYWTEGGKFLCQVEAEKSFNKYDCKCGWKNPTRIVGGSETGVNEYPMMAGLYDNSMKVLYCGATIISNQHVITAAHCLERRNISNIFVVVGEHDVNTVTETNATKPFRISKCDTHPYYQNNDNDIAVCKINGTIEFNAMVGPACLPFQHYHDSFGGDIVQALGWGLLDFGGAKSSTLQEVDLNVLSQVDCENYYPGINMDTHICTYTPGKDTCQMDSGGPVLRQDYTTQNLILVGITSFGVGCAGDEPAVDTRVGAYIDWIMNVTRGVQYCKDRDCSAGSLTIKFPGQIIPPKYCGKGNVTLEGKNPTITLDTPSWAPGGVFLCQVQSEKPFDEYDCECGWKNPTKAPTIVGGSETGVNEYPMMAGLYDNSMKVLYCGATIISNQHVITAAHCLENRNINNIFVVVGEHDVNTVTETNATKPFRISKCDTHPYYRGSENDIAVCKIIGTIEFSTAVGPVCLPFQHHRDTFGGAIVQALGWGLLDFGGAKSSTLQKVHLNVINPAKCKSYYPGINMDNHVCTYTPGKDTCQMDSGGPVLWQNPTTHNLVLVGITSFGVGCAGDEPAVDTRVGAYIDWIMSVTRGVRYCKME